MHPSAELRHRLGSKIVMTRLADEAGVPSVPHVIGRAGSYDELSALAQDAGLGDDLVVEAAYGDAGSATFFLRGPRDWDHCAADLVAQQEVESHEAHPQCRGVPRGHRDPPRHRDRPRDDESRRLPGADSVQGRLVRQ